MLRFSVLGSGSAGNSAVACSGQTRILIDAGLSARQLCLRLETVGIDPNSLSAIVLTHEHGDHVRGLDVFLRKCQVPVYATSHTCQVVREGLRTQPEWRLFEAGDSFAVNDVQIETFSVPHDAVDPVGFVLECARTRVGVLSDIGHVTNLVRARLAGVHTLFVESNYDEVMLQNDVKRPWSTKQRISSRHGHLSNDQAAELVAAMASAELHRVVLGHLSRDCNAPKVAAETVSAGLRKLGFSEVDVICAGQNEPLPLRDAALLMAEAVVAETLETVDAAAADGAAAGGASARMREEEEPVDSSETKTKPQAKAKGKSDAASSRSEKASARHQSQPHQPDLFGAWSAQAG